MSIRHQYYCVKKYSHDIFDGSVIKFIRVCVTLKVLSGKVFYKPYQNPTMVGKVEDTKALR